MNHEKNRQAYNQQQQGEHARQATLPTSASKCSEPKRCEYCGLPALSQASLHSEKNNKTRGIFLTPDEARKQNEEMKRCRLAMEGKKSQER